jgi:hypothetical protein
VSESVSTNGDDPAAAASADGSRALILNAPLDASRLVGLGSAGAVTPTSPDPASGAVGGTAAAPLGASGFVAAWRQGATVRVNAYSGSAWGTPATLQAPGSGPYPVLAAGSATGTAAVAWTMLDNGYEVYAARYSAGAWSAPTRLAPLAGENDVRQRDSLGPAAAPAVDAAGNVYVAWVQEATPDFSNWHVRVRRCPAALPMTACEPAVELDTRPERIAGTPVLAAAPNGDVYAAWISRQSGGDEVRVARRSAAGWEPAVTVGVDALVDRPVLTVDGQGRAIVAWVGSDGHYERVMVSRTQ